MKFFQLVPTHTDFDFIGKFKYFIAFSIITAIITLWGIFHHGFNFGIDFSGGSVMQVKFNSAIHPDEVRKIMTELGEPDASVVSVGTGDLEYLITSRPTENPLGNTGSANEKAAAETSKTTAPSERSKGENDSSNNSITNETKKIRTTLAQKLVSKVGPSNITIQRADEVGPKVGAELKLAALRSLLYSVICIAIYIWLRFDFRFAPGATVMMIHDLIISSAFYLFTGREFTITSIAALLTIAGYSVNDTIVVYDRVREIAKKAGGAIPLPQMINRAINQTLSRTILTSVVTLISVIPIMILCSGEIQSFAIAMGIGIFVGTYSTIYIAAPFAIYIEKFMDYRKNKNSNRKAVVA